MEKLFFLKISRVNEAEKLFLRASKLYPDSTAVHAHYGLFLLDAGRWAIQ